MVVGGFGFTLSLWDLCGVPSFPAFGSFPAVGVADGFFVAAPPLPPLAEAAYSVPRTLAALLNRNSVVCRELGVSSSPFFRFSAPVKAHRTMAHNAATKIVPLVSAIVVSNELVYSRDEDGNDDCNAPRMAFAQSNHSETPARMYARSRTRNLTARRRGDASSSSWTHYIHILSL